MAGVTDESRCSGLGKSSEPEKSSSPSEGASKCLTKGLCSSCAALAFRSFHIRYLANEKVPRTSSVLTSNPGTSRTARRTMFQMPVTSMPLSSLGSSPSSPGISNSKSCRSSSSSVRLKRGSSSRRLSVTPDKALLRSSFTGSKIRGAE